MLSGRHRPRGITWATAVNPEPGVSAGSSAVWGTGTASITSSSMSSSSIRSRYTPSGSSGGVHMARIAHLVLAQQPAQGSTCAQAGRPLFGGNAGAQVLVVQQLRVGVDGVAHSGAFCPNRARKASRATSHSCSRSSWR